MAVDHYENFPVASPAAAAHLREPVEAIYAFARSADDVADEGDAPAVARLARLHDYRLALEACAHGVAVKDETLAPMFARLGGAIRAHKLPLQPFRNLLDAFSQDVGKTRYRDFAELQDYCRRSADPVGRLLLCLYDAATPDNLRRSDAICNQPATDQLAGRCHRLAEGAHLPATGRHGALRHHRERYRCRPQPTMPGAR